MALRERVRHRGKRECHHYPDFEWQSLQDLLASDEAARAFHGPSIDVRDMPTPPTADYERPGTTPVPPSPDHPSARVYDAEQRLLRWRPLSRPARNGAGTEMFVHGLFFLQVLGIRYGAQVANTGGIAPPPPATPNLPSFMLSPHTAAPLAAPNSPHLCSPMTPLSAPAAFAHHDSPHSGGGFVYGVNSPHGGGVDATGFHSSTRAAGAVPHEDTAQAQLMRSIGLGGTRPGDLLPGQPLPASNSHGLRRKGHNAHFTRPDRAGSAAPPGKYGLRVYQGNSKVAETWLAKGDLRPQLLKGHLYEWLSGLTLVLTRKRRFAAVEVVGAIRVPAQVMLGQMCRFPRRTCSYTEYLNTDPTPPYALTVRDVKTGMPTPYSVVLDFDFTPAEAIYAFGYAVPTPRDCLYPLRGGNHVTLYQDACVHPEEIERHGFNKISDAQGRPYMPGSCWQDVLSAIVNAKHFIYITGWSVDTAQRLVRGAAGGPASMTLGELLKAKADSGVRVLMMIWDDFFSKGTTEAVMSTHDEETKRYFKGSNVVVSAVYRSTFRNTAGSGSTSSAKNSSAKLIAGMSRLASLMFTHHQKTVICDAEPAALGAGPPGAFYGSRSPGSVGGVGGIGSPHSVAPPLSPGRRSIMAFVGGLDLTDGRYDTPSHPLWSTNFGDHYKDFHNESLPGCDPERGDPRQPWHDIHSRLIGPVARDVMENFEMRWLRQAEGLHSLLLTHPQKLAMFLSPQEERVVAAAAAKYLRPSGSGGTWNVQMTRSIDEHSAILRNPVTAMPDRRLDASIQVAYSRLIRGAKRYIYLENQYFVGSSSYWGQMSEFEGTSPNQGAPNLVPIELAMRVCRAIRDGDPFHIYLVIPLWSEGDPSSGAVQEILHFQFNTISFMYNKIVDVLDEVGSPAHPQDYFTVYAPVAREAPTALAVPCGVPSVAPVAPAVHSGFGGLAPTVGPGSSKKPLLEVPVASAAVPASGVLRGGGGVGAAVPVQPLAHGPYENGAARRDAVKLSRRFPIYVHSKMMIVDDDVLIVGSVVCHLSCGGLREGCWPVWTSCVEVCVAVVGVRGARRLQEVSWGGGCSPKCCVLCVV